MTDDHNNFELVTSDKSRAAELKFRSDLIIMIRMIAHKNGWDQKQISEKLGIPQPRVSELTSGKVTLFSADKLIGFLSKLGVLFGPDFDESGEITCKVIVKAL